MSNFVMLETKARLVTHAVSLLADAVGEKIGPGKVIEMLKAPRSADHISVELSEAQAADWRQPFQVEIRFRGILYHFHSTGPVMAGGIPVMAMTPATIHMVTSGSRYYREAPRYDLIPIESDPFNADLFNADLHQSTLHLGTREQAEPVSARIHPDRIVIHGTAGKRAQLLEDVLTAVSTIKRIDVDSARIDHGPFSTTVWFTTFKLRNAYQAYRTVVNGRLTAIRALKASVMRTRAVFG